MGLRNKVIQILDELLRIKEQIRSYGLDINRVTLPNITEEFMKGLPDREIELENTLQRS